MRGLNSKQKAMTMYHLSKQWNLWRMANQLSLTEYFWVVLVLESLMWLSWYNRTEIRYYCKHFHNTHSANGQKRRPNTKPTCTHTKGNNKWSSKYRSDSTAWPYLQSGVSLVSQRQRSSYSSSFSTCYTHAHTHAHTHTHHIPHTLETGATVCTALKVLKEHGVDEGNVVLVSLFCTAQGAHTTLAQYPNVTMLTSEVHDCCPAHFGQKYFGSDWLRYEVSQSISFGMFNTWKVLSIFHDLQVMTILHVISNDQIFGGSKYQLFITAPSLSLNVTSSPSSSLPRHWTS